MSLSVGTAFQEWLAMQSKGMESGGLGTLPLPSFAFVSALSVFQSSSSPDGNLTFSSICDTSHRQRLGILGPGRQLKALPR